MSHDELINFCTDMLDRRTDNVVIMAHHLREFYHVFDKNDMCDQLDEFMKCFISLLSTYETLKDVRLRKWQKGYRYDN